MPTFTIEELAEDSYNPVAKFFQKYTEELEVAVRSDVMGHHYFVYVGALKIGNLATKKALEITETDGARDNLEAERAMKLFKSLLVDLLSPKDADGYQAPEICRPRYWTVDGERNYPSGRYYATMSLVVSPNVGGQCGMIHFFLNRKDFDVATKHDQTIGYDHND